MNVDVLSTLVTLTLTEEQARSLNEANGEDLAVEDLPYIELRDLIEAGVGRSKARRLLKTIWPRAEEPTVTPAAPQQITVQIDSNAPPTLDSITLNQAVDFLSGEVSIPSDAEFGLSAVAQRVDAMALFPFVVLTSDGKLDRVATRNCLNETWRHGSQRTWEGRSVVKATTLVVEESRYRDPLFSDPLTTSLYNNQRNYSWAPAALRDGVVDITVLGIGYFAICNSEVDVTNTRDAMRVVEELADPKSPFWESRRSDYLSLNEASRFEIERDLIVRSSSSHTQSSPYTPPPVDRSTGGMQFSDQPLAALQELLVAMYRTNDLARFLERKFPGITDSLPSTNTPVVDYADRSTEVLWQRGLINAMLFANLKLDVPGQTPKIQTVQARFGF